MTALPDVLAALTLGPEDRLVLTFPTPMTCAEHDEALEIIREAGLSGRVLLINSGQAIVLRATTAEGMATMTDAAMQRIPYTHDQVLAILDLHAERDAPFPARYPVWSGLRRIAVRHQPAGLGYCAGCAGTHDPFPRRWPCADIRDLAQALGFTLTPPDGDDI